METRLGTLEFFDGFPTDASVQKLYDNLDFQRAVQAYLLAIPAANQAAMRKALLQWGPANTTMPIWEDLVFPRTVGLTFNTSTPYCWMWLDLHDGPLVAEVPPGVLGAINDHWYRWVVDVGMTGPDKGKGGKYLILPPRWEGEVPEGYFVARAQAYEMFLAWRTFPDEKGDLKPAVERTKKLTKVYPLAKAGNPPPMKFVNISPEPFVTVGPGDYQFWELLDGVVQSEPPWTGDPVTLGFFAAIGIEHGKPFAPDARMKKILTEAAAVGDATARALTYRMREKEAFYYEGSAWRTAFLGGYAFERNGIKLLDSVFPVLLLRHRRHPGDGSQDGRFRLPVRARLRGRQGPAARRQPHLSAARAPEGPGQQFLVRHRLRQPDPLLPADRPDLAVGHEQGQGLPRQRRRLGGRLLRPRAAKGRPELHPDHPRQGLERDLPALRSARARGSTRPGGSARSNRSSKHPVS